MRKEIILTDEEILDLYFSRSEDAIKETDKKYGKYLYTIAYNILRDERDCEECLNDTYLKAWNSFPPVVCSRWKWAAAAIPARRTATLLSC